jgi:hypothetical protein
MRDFVRSAIAMLAVAAFALCSPAVNSAMAQTPKQAPAPAAKQPAAAPQAAPAPAPLNQIELTEKQIVSLLAAQKDMDAVSDKLPEGASDNPDPKLQAQFDAIVKKNGFASFDEYGAVYDNVSLVMSGIDPKTKTFTEPPEALKKQIVAVQAEAKIPAKDKKAILDDMNQALKTIEPVKYPGNVTLVTKYYDKLGALMQDDE